MTVITFGKHCCSVMEAKKGVTMGDVFQVYVSDDEGIDVQKDPGPAAHFLEGSRQENENLVWYEYHAQANELPQAACGNDIGSEEPSSCQSQPAKRWTYKATQHLIKEYADHRAEFISASKPNRKIWAEIAEKIEKVDGLVFQPDQIENKWKNLKKAYKNIVDTKKPGSGSVSWPFYGLMEHALGKRPEVRPLSVASSSGGFRSFREPMSSSPAYNNIAHRQTDESPQVSPQAKKRKQEPKWFREFINVKRKQHEEKMSVHREILALLKDVSRNSNKFCGKCNCLL